MAIFDFYEIMGQLYTSTIFREKFFENPQSMLKLYILNEHEINALLKLNYTEIVKFSQLIKEKNKRSTEKEFFILFSKFRERFDSLYDKAYELLPRFISETDIDYNIRIGYFFQKMVLSFSDLPDYCIDLLKYITNRLKCISQNFPNYIITSKKYSINRRPTFYPTIIYETYNYRIEEIILSMYSTYKPEKKTHHSLMYFLNKKTYFFSLDKKMEDILSLCKKGYTIRQIYNILKNFKFYSESDLIDIQHSIFPDLIKKRWIYYK